MAFIPWKDRVTATPHRYKLTEVGADTYDLEAVPGAVSEAGTPMTAANMDRLIQRDGDDIKDTVVAFTEAGARANISTGESTATLFGKVKKYFTDLKTHAFTAPSTTRVTSADTVPSDKTLYDCTLAAVYTALTDSRLTGITTSSTIIDICSAMANNSFAHIQNASTYSNVPPAGISQSGVFKVYKGFNQRHELSYSYGGQKWIGNYSVALGWSGWKQIIDDSSAQDITGVKKFTASPIVPISPSGSSSAVSKSYADSVGFARVYRSFADLGIPNSSTIAQLHSAMINRSRAIISASTYPHSAYGNTGLELPNNLFYVLEAIRSDDQRLTLKLVGKATNSDVLYQYEGMYWDLGDTNKFTGWKRVINNSDVVPYDRVIRLQAEFNELINSATWLDATNVALVGQFTLDTANSGIEIPATVKQIHGFNGAKITITNFLYNSSTAKGGLWYATAPTTEDYSIRDLEVSCTGTNEGYGFTNCINLSNCTGTGTGATGRGFSYCNNLSNCTGKGTVTGTGTSGYGFYHCNSLSNCTGTGTGLTSGYGFYRCNNISNCTGTGTGTAASGYGFDHCNSLSNCTGTGTGVTGNGFSFIDYAVNCKDGGSSTNMWGEKNYNINVETCRKSPEQAVNATLNADP